MRKSLRSRSSIKRLQTSLHNNFTNIFFFRPHQKVLHHGLIKEATWLWRLFIQGLLLFVKAKQTLVQTFIQKEASRATFKAAEGVFSKTDIIKWIIVVTLHQFVTKTHTKPVRLPSCYNYSPMSTKHVCRRVTFTSNTERDGSLTESCMGRH